MSNINIFKHLSWKIKYEAGDMPYPAILFWKKKISKEDIRNAWKNTISYVLSHETQHNLGLYVHIPFCYTKCFFCTCVTQVEHEEKAYDDYLDLIERESIFFADTFKNVKFNSVYVGGGTPTILTPQQIDRFYCILKQNFNLSKVKQIMTEGSPYTTTEEKMKVLASHGVNKMTFGVQSLDSKTLKKNNRFQQFDDVKNAIELARKFDIEYINLDIMAGLPGQDMEGFRETIDLIETLNPTTVHVNSFWPTKNTNFIKTGGEYGYKEIKLRNEMEKYGKYLEDHESKITDTRKQNLQLFNAHNYNSSILGLGYGAISHAFGNLHYDKGSFSKYRRWLDSETIVFNGFKLNIDDEMITYSINNLRGGLFYEKFKELFFCDLESTKIFKSKLERLIGQGIIVSGENKDFGRYIKFRINSDLFSSIYSKYLYDSSLIAEFYAYIQKHPSEFLNLDLRIKQFFTD